MLVAVKTPRISVRVTGVGAQTVVKALRQLYEGVEVSRDDEAVDITTTAWWKETDAGLTLEKLAALSGIAKSHLSDMENGKRAIGLRTAKKLATALGVDHRLFL
jgi:DNA-binding XRE family transcriptional regulator